MFDEQSQCLTVCLYAPQRRASQNREVLAREALSEVSEDKEADVAEQVEVSEDKEADVAEQVDALFNTQTTTFLSA